MALLCAGFAQREITPALRGNFLDGYGFRLSPAESIRDPLYVKTCVLVCGKKVHLIASFDLIGFSPRVYTLISDQITGLCGIPREDMSLCCIHTHAAPVSGVLDELPMDYDYLAWVGEQCGRAAAEARDRAVPGRFAFDITPETLVNCYNRRGRNVIDPSIRCASFTDADGCLRGVVCSASCHAVINGGMTVSADFLSVLNAASTDEMPLLYLQNRGADVDPMRGGDLDCDTAIEQLGRQLTDPVLRASSAHAGEALPPEEGSMTCVYEEVTLPMLSMTDREALLSSIRALEEQYFALDRDDITKHYTLRELQWTRAMLRRLDSGAGFDLTVPLQLLAFGKSFIFAFVPFEMLTLTGDALEKILADAGYERKTIFTVGYANSVNGYLAPAEEFPYGGYEVGGAAHWYGIPQNDVTTEPAMLQWFAEQASKL